MPNVRATTFVIAAGANRGGDSRAASHRAASLRSKGRRSTRLSVSNCTSAAYSSRGVASNSPATSVATSSAIASFRHRAKCPNSSRRLVAPGRPTVASSPPRNRLTSRRSNPAS